MQPAVSSPSVARRWLQGRPSASRLPTRCAGTPGWRGCIANVRGTMATTDVQQRPNSDLVLVQPIEGSPNLVRLPPAVRSFLFGVERAMSAETILVAVVLVGEAFRYGTPPVWLRLWLVDNR